MKISAFSVGRNAVKNDSRSWLPLVEDPTVMAWIERHNRRYLRWALGCRIPC